MLIDRYIGRAMLHAFVIVFISLAGLYIVFDAFTNMEEFISRAGDSAGIARLLTAYYGCRMVWFFDATSPVIALASAMFAISWLERHNEITALLAAGVTRWRIARATLVFAAAVSLLAIANREWLLPEIRTSFARNVYDLEGSRDQPFDARYDLGSEILFRGRSARAVDCRIDAPSLLMPPHLGDYGPQIDAAEGFWRPASAAVPAGYLLRGVSEPPDIDRLEPLDCGGRPVVLTRAAADWLQPGECFVASEVTFEQLIGSTNWSQYSSTPQLLAAIRNPSLGVGADIPLRIHARVVQPLLDMALVLLGLPLVLGPARRGIFVAIGMCIAMTVVFLLTVMGCHALALGDAFSPSFGAWLPLLTLAPLAAWRAQPMWH